jgi:hypothetical protein
MINNPALTGGPALWVGHHLSDSSDKIYAVWIEHHPPTAYRVMTGFGPRRPAKELTLGPRGIYEMLAGAEGEMTKIVAEKSHDYVSIDAEAYKQVGMVTFGEVLRRIRSAGRIYQYPGQKVVDMLTAPAEPRIKDGLNRLLVEAHEARQRHDQKAAALFVNLMHEASKHGDQETVDRAYAGFTEAWSDLLRAIAESNRQFS